MKKPRLRKAGLLAQNHIARRWGSENLNPGLSDSKAGAGVLKDSDSLPLRGVGNRDGKHWGSHHTPQFGGLPQGAGWAVEV